MKAIFYKIKKAVTNIPSINSLKEINNHLLFHKKIEPPCFLFSEEVSKILVDANQNLRYFFDYRLRCFPTFLPYKL